MSKENLYSICIFFSFLVVCFFLYLEGIDYDKIKSKQTVKKKPKQLSVTFIFVWALIKKYPDLFGPLHLLHVNEKKYNISLRYK